MTRLKKKKYKKRVKGERITNKNLVDYVLTLVVWTLRNNEGDPWGVKRLEKFVDKLHENYEFVISGEVSLLDIRKQLELETGIKIELQK